MEIYQRKRFKTTNVDANTERKYLKSSVDGAQTLHTGGHKLQKSDCTLQSHETSMEIEVGSVYEIDRTALPPRTPAQLRSIRVVMVSEKTEWNVTVRFPSIQSLRRYFSNRVREMYPALDEKFVMGTKLAGEVLFRQVGSQEFAEKKHLEDFWSVIPTSIRGTFVEEEEEPCSLAMKCNEMVKWGVRRQVRFIGKHREVNRIQTLSSSSFVTGGEKLDQIGDEREEEEREDEEEEEIEDEEEEEEEAVTEDDTKKKRKRKCRSKIVQRPKKARREMRKEIRNPKDRWSTERYKLAEQNLLEVMKSKDAVHGNPILRPALRAEARKRIGDTGLLDHLLKHMAGKVAPGGTERFRRRHNAEGAMEYWLEQADLVELRREAGVQDPYWTPPPGWKLGDCLNQDPVCTKQWEKMKEETSELKRAMNEMVSKKELVDEITKLKRELKEMVCEKEKKDTTQANVVSNACHELCLDSSLISSNSDSDKTLVTLEKYKDQILVITKYLNGMEGHIRELMSKVEEGTSLSKLKENHKEVEEKAAKRQRLKSGFRICKPQGTFMWPNMALNNTNNLMSPQVEDLFVVPTPPSVSSSAAIALPQLPHHHHHYPASPAKPLAERRAVTVTVSTSTTTTTTTTTNTKKTTTPINLNDFPPSPEDGFCGTPSSCQTAGTPRS